MFTTTVAWPVCGPVCHPLVNIFARSWLWWVAQIPARWPYSTLLRTKGTPQVLYSMKISTKISGWKTEVHFATHFDEVFNVAFGEQTVVSWDYVSWNSYWTMLRNISARTNTHTFLLGIYSPMVFRRKDAVPKDANKPNDIWVNVLRTGCTPIWVAQLSCSRPCAWSRREECWIMFSEQRWSWVSSVPLVIRLRSRRLCSDLNLENFGALQSTEIREVF